MSRGRSFGRAALLAAGLCFVLSNLASASPILSFSVNMSGNEWSTSLVGQPIPGSKAFFYQGSKPEGGWTGSWTMTGDPDPVVTSNLFIQNNTAFTQTFTTIVTLPSVPR